MNVNVPSTSQNTAFPEGSEPHLGFHLGRVHLLIRDTLTEQKLRFPLSPGANARRLQRWLTRFFTPSGELMFLRNGASRL